MHIYFSIIKDIPSAGFDTWLPILSDNSRKSSEIPECKLTVNLIDGKVGKSKIFLSAN